MTRPWLGFLLLTVAALAIALASRWRDDLIDTSVALPLTFAHLDHREVNCITCHHNYVDRTGLGLCINCHKTDPAIRADIEPMFHTLCRDCHVKKRADGDEAGPARRCSDCHQPDDAF